MLVFIWEMARRISSIIRSESFPCTRMELLCEYIRMKCKQLVLVNLLGLNISAERIFGLKVNLLSYSSFMLMFEEIFIERQYYFKAEKDNPLIIDCGSNIGVSILFFKKLYPQARILAFEPDTRAFKILKANINANGLENVEIFNKAIYNSDGLVDFYYNPNSPGSLVMSLEKRRMPTVYSSEKVHSVALSDYIKEHVDCLKLDIEGSEGFAIDELARSVSIRQINEIFIEYHHHVVPENNQLSQLLRDLEENGFGYQITSSLRLPFSKRQFQDILIYAYHEKG